MSSQVWSRTLRLAALAASGFLLFACAPELKPHDFCAGVHKLQPGTKNYNACMKQATYELGLLRQQRAATEVNRTLEMLAIFGGATAPDPATDAARRQARAIADAEASRRRQHEDLMASMNSPRLCSASPLGQSYTVTCY